MPQNVQRGMVRDDEQLFQRQIVELLANPRIGPVSAAAIAANLGVSPDRIASALGVLIHAGQLICVAPDAYTASPVVDGQPLRPHPYLAPAATPLYVPEALRGDWLWVGERVTGNAKDAKSRGGREEGGQRRTAEETEERAEGEQRGAAEDAEDAQEEGRKRSKGIEGADGTAASAPDGSRP